MTNKNKINDLQLMFCPFGYLDLKRCVDIANEINKDNDWIFEQIEDLSNECEIRLDKIDPVAACLDAILQTASYELSKLIKMVPRNQSKGRSRLASRAQGCQGAGARAKLVRRRRRREAWRSFLRKLGIR